MKYLLLTILFLPEIVNAQAQFVLNNNVYVVMDNSVFIVVDNPNSNAISTVGTGGNIISENETNLIRWNVNTSSGTYTIPYTTTPAVQGGNDTKIPLEIQITAAGTGGSGRIDFATYETTNDNNTTYPTGVLNMFSSLIAGDASLFAVDRFWIIDANSYTTKPAVTLEFGYDDAANEIALTNTIAESNLQAQRYEPVPDNWGAFIDGVANTLTNRVSNVVVPVLDFEAVWVLIDNTTPLPIELLDFEAIWQDETQRAVDLWWATASESNNDYFWVERSLNGIDFSFVLESPAVGNSTQLNTYSDVDFSPFPGVTSYYRLKQVDENGHYSYSDIVAVMSNSSNGFSFYPNPASDFLFISNSTGGSIDLVFVNAIGQVVLSKTVHKKLESIDISNLNSGIYFVTAGRQSAKFIKY